MIIFLSHSASDKELASEIAMQLEAELEADVFVSSRASAIPSGEVWFNSVIENLDMADALVILLTKKSETSTWVGFEFGYYWRKADQQGIFTLRHPKSTIPTPLDVIQAKVITDENEIQDFFTSICAYFGRAFTNRANIASVINAAKASPSIPPDSSLERFIQYLETATWTEESMMDESKVWICDDNALFQIFRTREREKEFRERWTERFPDPDASLYVVELKISNVTIKQLSFIALDGGRYFVPMPRITLRDNEQIFYWDQESLECKVGKWVNSFYHDGDTLESVAARSGVEIY